MKKSLLILLLTSCVETEILNEVNTEMPSKAIREFENTTHNEDTTRIPITFNPTVEDWEDTEIDMNY